MATQKGRMAEAIPPSPSAGCSIRRSDVQPPLTIGARQDFLLPFRPLSGQQTNFRLSLPTDYLAREQPLPLLLSFHGWGETLDDSNDLHDHGIRNSYVVAAPLGYDDGDATMYTSFNGAGTTRVWPLENAASGGKTCRVFSSRYQGNCYPSCGACQDKCSWTTCEDSVAQTEALLDHILATVCVDERRVFATGESNGGIFLFELARDFRMQGRIAGYVPVIGLPHASFLPMPRTGPVPLTGIWGRSDTTIPPFADPGASGNVSISSDSDMPGEVSFMFWSAEETTRAWARANGCEGEPRALNSTHLAKDWEARAEYNLSCSGWTWTQCKQGAEVIRCYFDGEHEIPAFRGAAIHSFMRRHALGASQLAPSRPHAWLSAGSVGLTPVLVETSGTPSGWVSFLLIGFLIFVVVLLIFLVSHRRRTHEKRRLLSSLRQRGITVARMNVVELPVEQLA